MFFWRRIRTHWSSDLPLHAVPSFSFSGEPIHQSWVCNFLTCDLVRGNSMWLPCASIHQSWLFWQPSSHWLCHACCHFPSQGWIESAWHSVLVRMFQCLHRWKVWHWPKQMLSLWCALRTFLPRFCLEQAASKACDCTCFSLLLASQQGQSSMPLL